jgi:hypothetical protein
MKTFADNAGRTWALKVDVSTIRRVRDVLELNLLELVDLKSNMLERLYQDPCLLCDILFVLVKPEAEAKGVTDEDFGRSLGGDALGDATDALLTEIVDFFPKGRRELLTKILSKWTAMQGKAVGLASRKLDSPELAKLLDRALEEMMDGFGPVSNTSAAGSSPDSSESTPDRTPSGN